MFDPRQKLRAIQCCKVILLKGLFFLLIAGQLQAQKTNYVTFSGKNVTLREVFNSIRQQTGYSLLFGNDKVNLNFNEKVTVNFRRSSLSDALNTLLTPLHLKWILQDESIIVTRAENTQAVPPPDGYLLRDRNIYGTVTDAEGHPIQGATITIKGTGEGTATDPNGQFILHDLPLNTTLLVSSIGFETVQIPLKGEMPVITLHPAVSTLDETVVIAYGTTTNRLNTGNVASVKAKDIEKQPVTNPLLALQGRVAGLLVTQNTGIAGGGVTVRVQGQNSINNGNDPLYVIDGVPVNAQLPGFGLGALILGNSGTAGSAPQGEGNPLSFLNPADIESIEVLKDADATAIYGSRAANGAILITTKKGKAGKTKADITMQRGWGKVTRHLDMMNTRQYLDMRYEAYKNDGIDISTLTLNSTNYDLTLWDTTKYTDWQKVLIGGTADYTQVNSTLSGGTQNIQYLFGGTYNNQTTVFPFPKNFSDKRGALHFSINTSSANEKFRAQLSGNYTVDNNKLPARDLTSMALTMEPNTPDLFNSDGTLNWALDPSGLTSLVNPMAALYSNYTNKTTNLVSNLQLSYRILPGLELRSSFGYTNMQTQEFFPVPIVSIRPNWRYTVMDRNATLGSRNINSWLAEPQLDYKRQIGEGNLQVLAGASFQSNNTDGISVQGTGFSSDEVLRNIQAASTYIVQGLLLSQYKYNAVFGRVNYDWKNKYIINLTARRDGSSRFGPANRFHNFGAVGAAWIISEENFLRSIENPISFLKLKASYGTTGNDQIKDYGYLGLYGQIYGLSYSYQNSPSLSPYSLPNPKLQWEETRKLQGGIEVGLLKDKIFLTAVYASNRSSNQLLPYGLPSTTGFYSIETFNFPAVVRNTSWEFTLATTNIRSKKFQWTTNVNLTIPKNRLIAFPNIETSTYANILVIGQPVDMQKLYRYKGVDPQTGLYTFYSKTDPFNPVFPDDATVIASMFPKFYGGLQNNIQYKGFQLDFLFQFIKQSGQSMEYSFAGGVVRPGSFFRQASNQPTTVLSRWQKPGDITNIQQFSSELFGAVSNQANIVQASDAAFTDASFVRLKTLSLAWNLPENWQKRVALINARLFIQGQNLLTITRYKGLDPENKGYQSLPPLRIWTLGLQVGI